jgi:acyl-CoA reductase-like NAD-dependent aldehyde dehydrogenase
MAPLRDSYGLFINGRFADASDGREFDSTNPATGAKLATVAWASSRDVKQAVQAARRAQEKVWGPMKPAERAKYLFRIARLLAERAREFAVLETLDGGKPIRESRDVDVPLAAQHFFYHAGWADKLEHAGLGGDPRPLGVVGQVIPWNFPLLMAAWKVAPALACGNTVVLKPAETTPLSALLLAEVCAEAGLPPGVLNVVPGAGDVGHELVCADVDKVAFTGSTDVGRAIAQAVAGSDKRLTLELGGKGANIVFADASMDEAVEGIVDGIFFNQGHVCCAGSRLLVEESVAGNVVRLLQERMGLVRVGDPMDKNTDMGAINSSEQLRRIRQLVQVGESEGATAWTPACELPDRGYFHAPTLLLGVESSDTVARDEIFGPVLSVLTFRTPDEAVVKANDTPYGLACGIWSEKGSRALWVAERVRAGVVWTNCYNLFDAAAPFGGFRESGYGREGGRVGLEAYLAID